MPPDSQSFNQDTTPDVMVIDEPVTAPVSAVETATDMVNVGNNVGRSLPRLSSSDNEMDVVQPSTSSNNSDASKILRFNVQYCDRIVSVELPETATVGEL